MKKHCFYYTLLFGLVVLADRLSKYWAITSIRYNDISVSRFFDFSFGWNKGISWGIFNQSSRLGFILLTSFIAVIILIFLGYTVMEYLSGKKIYMEILVISGAVSNFFDRLYYGAVIDFIDFHYGALHWPTFNIADMCIVIGIGGIFIRGIFHGK
jgi:signal peptidase II